MEFAWCKVDRRAAWSSSPHLPSRRYHEHV